MTAVLRPSGRGNWRPFTITFGPAGKHGPLPLELHPGQRIVIAGKTFRISKVQP